MTVLSDLGRCFLATALVKPDHAVQKLSSMALHHVFTGEAPAVACRQAINDAMVVW